MDPPPHRAAISRNAQLLQLQQDVAEIKALLLLSKAPQENTASSLASHQPTLLPTMDPGLYKAATSGDVEFLEQVANVVNTQILLSKAPQENTALHIVSRFGHANFTRKILQLCSQLLRMKNSDHDTALHCAARAGCLQIVQILMETGDHDDLEQDGGPSWSSGRLLRMQNKEGNTALHEALKYRREDVAIKMVRADPRLPFVVNNARESSFLVAVEMEMVGFVKEILHGTEDYVIPKTAGTQLTAEERRELVKIQDDNGRTALHYAVWRDNEMIVGLILKTDNRYVPYMVDKNGHSPLHAAVAFGIQRSVSELLKYCPDSIEQVDSGGRNVLHIAVLHGRENIIEELLKQPQIEGLLDSPDKEGNTSVRLAIQLGRESRQLRKKITRRGATTFRARPHRMPDVAHIKKIDLKVRKNQQRVLMLIASLIATVSFEAVFTLPGGYRSGSEANPGTAILTSKPAFKAFVLLDTLALSFSIFAIIVYLSAWVPTIAEDQPEIVVTILALGHFFTVIACVCMLFAFSAGVFVVVTDESRGLAILVIVICCTQLVYSLYVIIVWISPPAVDVIQFLLKIKNLLNKHRPRGRVF